MDLITIQGHFIFEKFRSSDYAVYSFKLYDYSEKTITVNGNIPLIENNVLYELQGQYVEHKKYGLQFECIHTIQVVPTEYEYTLRFLKSNRFKGIGEKTALSIIEILGDNCLVKIKEDPELLKLVPNLNSTKIASILEGLQEDSSVLQDNLLFFTKQGITYKQILKINRIYGDKAIELLSENPYSIIYDVTGIGFETAKKLASSLEFSDDNGYYFEALLVSLVLKYAVSCGDSYIDFDKLESLYCKHASNFDEAFNMAILNRHIILDDNKVFHSTQYEAEFGITSFFKNYPYEYLDEVDNDEIKTYIKFLEDNYQIEYDELQKDAIDIFMKSSFSILTGGPGTGKTTVVKAMIDVFKNFYPNHQLICIAPTGRASKRLKELCDTEALTIHSLLSYDLETNSFGKNADNSINYDALIIDEASMIDNWLFYNLLLASKQVKKICIIGDEDQLPSVGPGQLLKDLIDSTRFTCTRLNTIHRQKEGSDIIGMAALIRNGDATFDEHYQDIKFYNVRSMDIHHYIADVVAKALDKGYSIQEIQVLACMYRGAAGIDNLNNQLQTKFNPAKNGVRELKVGFITFRENDKILQLKNQADDDVYNGDIGILIEIVYAKEAIDNVWHIFVNFDGIIVEYTSDNIQNITLAYCVSVHKSQGSEYPIVILALSSDQSRMFQRKLLYTAVTRAKKSLVLIGDYEVYQKACVTLDTSRQTALQKRLLP